MFSKATFIFLLVFASVAGRLGLIALVIATAATFLIGMVAKYLLGIDIYKSGS